MKASNSVHPFALILMGFIFIPLLSAQENPPPSTAEIARHTLAYAQELFTSGEYQACLEIISRSIGEYESGSSQFPLGIMAKIYGLDALLAFSFREAGSEEEIKEKIDKKLQKAVELDMDLELGDPASVPPFVLDRLSRVRSAYLSRFLRTTRRNSVGLFFALILEPTVLQNPSLLQPGLSYSFNISEFLTVEAGLRFPLQIPIWNSIRGQLGLVWYPSFRVEKFATGVSFSYIFGIDELSTTTHSLSLGGRLEFITRSGIGFTANAELLRADLILGSTPPTQQPTYNQIPLLGLFQVVFANVTLYAFYSF